MSSDEIPCSESFWLGESILDQITKSDRRVGIDEICESHGLVSDDLVINELRCLERSGKIRMVYEDMMCLFEVVHDYVA